MGSQHPWRASLSASSRVEWWLGLAAVLVVSAAYMMFFIDRGWIPHDEGTLSHSAARVMAGELPHRDFIEGYTGALTYLNAIAFRIFGVHLLAIRYVLFGAFIAWVLVYYQAAARMLSPRAGSVVTLIAVFWSVPNYPAAMPSWYNLFLATGGLAALLRYVDSEHRRWLVVAGFAGGLSVLMKTTGLFFIAAALLFLLDYESRFPADDREHRRHGVVFRLAVGAFLATAVIALVAIGVSRGSWIDVYQFAVPGLAMVAIIARNVFRARGPSPAAAMRILRSFMPFLLGAGVPVGAFVGFYAVKDALPDLGRGLFILPARLMDGASLVPPDPFAVIPIALAAFLLLEFTGRMSRITILQHALALAMCALMLVPKTAAVLEPFVWSSLAAATPLVVPVLAVIAAGRAARDADQTVRARLVLVGSVAAFCSLVQYPWAAPIYFAYSLPLLLLAVAVVLREMKTVRTRALPGFAGFYLVFGALYISPMKLPGLLGPVVRDDVALLDLPRAGLRISREDARNYPVAVELLRAHSSSGVVYAGPDAPELYFLSGLRNPTHAMFDYLVPDTLFHQRLLSRFDALGVNAVAIRKRVVHSPPLEPEILDALARQFPFSRDVGRFTVRWR